MNTLLLCLAGALLAGDQPPAAKPAAASAFLTQTNKVTEPASNDPVERQYQLLMEADDKAQGEVDEWIRENNAFEEKGAGIPKEAMNERIRLRFAPIRQGYEDFLRDHPNHAKAHIAYGSFLNDIREEDAAEAEWEKARKIDPKNPSSWNNLANHYGHAGPASKAFEYYEKAIELEPKESIYYHNLGTTVYLFRRDAMAYYKLDEQSVFNKALALYAQALKYDPDNFVLAHDVAQTYYGIRPIRTDDALGAWTNALKLATSVEEKQGVYIHMARFNMNAERFDLAHKWIAEVNLDRYADLKGRLVQNLAKQEADAKSRGTGATNAPPTAATAARPEEKAPGKPPQ